MDDKNGIASASVSLNEEPNYIGKVILFILFFSFI
jgi:hypothetical protein